RLAQEGADIIALDACEQQPNVPTEPATEADLAETVSQVEALDRRIVARKADVRNQEQIDAVVAEGVAQFGRLDVVSANAGIAMYPNLAHEMSDEEFVDMQQVNLVGVWRTAKAAIPHMIAAGNGGCIVLTSSEAGLKPYANAASYVSAKHGVVGLMRTLAVELAPHMIRVNSIHPTQVNTPMIMNEITMKLFRPDIEHPTVEDFAVASQATNLLPIPWVEAVDISNALLFLASEEARYITGVPLPVDAGCFLK
ncbi:mycofactocin-coupled SDR family oxidoreductase, partial [Leucobacter sp. wl10]|uniref:mycofactocin-coupled SDR family oxidoreductase n=1 Tax=Leucobacter sp. wl10 TaxID=2304677 RepID=UPI000E9B6C45